MAEENQPLQPPAPPVPAPLPPPVSEKEEYQKKLSDLEKRLQEEREKLLVANLKSQEEAVNAARVEVSLRELQEKLRRDRREQELEEERRKLEARLEELEERLAQERETWVTTLKNQVQAKDNQDRDIEIHFSQRLQEMERRWLEEKAQWQKLGLAKDEEIRTLKALSEKLKGADLELSRAVSDKKWLDSRVAELSQERAEALVRVQSAAEKEKQAIQLQADLVLARRELSSVQEKLERELQAARTAAKEREERLLAEQDRLQRDLETIAQRLRAEADVDIRRAKAEAEAEIRKHRESLDRGGAELLRLKGVCGALERQVAASRAVISELQRAKAEWEKAQERTKSEFALLQRKWAEREAEIRGQAHAQAAQSLESEKLKLKMQADGELRALRENLAQQIGLEKEAETRLRELRLKAELETQFQAERERLHQELLKKDSERQIEATRLSLELEKAQDQNRALQARLEELERLSSAQSAQVSQTRHDLERLRLQAERERILPPFPPPSP
ncbi:MAG: hypothetical protein HY921_08850 [Elusimicrobia bacterium]|nr:hypothetical protein [Elusimicrobiota bacterium]